MINKNSTKPLVATAPKITNQQDVEKLTHVEARAWLIQNDPEGDWEEMSDTVDFIEAVRDNVRHFGYDPAATKPCIVMGSTPGPWYVDDGVDNNENMVSCLEGSDWVAVGIHDEDGYAASVAYCHHTNAPLIAAAPELFATLRAIKARINGEFDCPELVAKGPLHLDEPEDFLPWINKALAKVLGG
jgi:hypothetical protein